MVAPPPTQEPRVATALGEESVADSAAARMFESLRIPDFRWYFAAQFGTWGAMNMQMFINGYLVFKLTDSFAALGLTALARSAPGIVLALVGGVMADRLPKKYLVQIAQFVSGGVALGVALLLAFDLLRFEHLLVSAFLQGAAMSLMMPARMAMLPGLVGIARIQNAQALGMGVMNLNRMAGPAVGGVMVAMAGAHYVYFLMSGLYFFAVVMYVKVPHVEVSANAADDGGLVPVRASAARDLVDGVRYVLRERTIGMLLGVNLAMVLVSMPYQHLLPGYVADVMGAGPEALGGLMSVAGIGALAAIVVIAAMPTHHRGKILILGAALMGVSLVAFSFSTSVLVAAPIMIVISVGQTIRMSLSSVLIQTYVDDAFRGRVSSLFMMEMSMVSFSTFIAGILASTVGPQVTIGSMAVILLAISTGVWFLVPRMRELD